MKAHRIAFLLTATLAAQVAPPVAVASGLEPTAPIAAEALVDTDGDGRAELVLITATGAVVRHRIVDGAFLAAGAAQLADPQHALLAFADLLAAPGVELIVADRSGTAAIVFADDGASAPTMLARRARCLLPLQRPQLSPFVLDLNRDGRLDFVLPATDGITPYLQEAAASDVPTFRALPALPARAQVELETSGRIRGERQGTLTIPAIETADLDGDGRPDLISRDDRRHQFVLQDEASGFTKKIEVDLEQFEDSTPAAALGLGSTLVLSERQQLQRGDIDGDGIPDFVIAHRRKVWTFLGSKQGPQFTKARTQAVADDISALLLVDLDEDERADLLTFQLQLPGAGTLLLGLVQSIDLDVKAVGYRAENGAFANTPNWRRTVTLRVPPLLSLLAKAEELVERFTTIVGKVRLGVRGPFTAAGRSDLAAVSADGKAVELFALSGAAPTLASRVGRRLLRKVLFDDPDPVFDIERMFGLLSGFLDDVSGSVVGDRAAIAQAPLRDTTSWRLLDLLAGDLRGDGQAQVVAVYNRVASADAIADALPQRAYDVLTLEPPK
jgi:hypothetical protein